MALVAETGRRWVVKPGEPARGGECYEASGPEKKDWVEVSRD